MNYRAASGAVSIYIQPTHQFCGNFLREALRPTRDGLFGRALRKDISVLAKRSHSLIYLETAKLARGYLFLAAFILAASGEAFGGETNKN